MQPPRKLKASPAKPLSGALGNIDDVRGHPGKGDTMAALRKEDNATQPDDEGLVVRKN